MSGARLSDQDIEAAVLLLEGWTDKLTWERYLAVLQTELGHLYTKMAMHKQPLIKAAWERAKARIAQSMSDGDARSNSSAAVVAMKERAQREERRADRLKAENEVLLDRFERWAYNAVQFGMTEEQLDRPIMVSDRQRGRSDIVPGDDI